MRFLEKEEYCHAAFAAGWYIQQADFKDQARALSRPIAAVAGEAHVGHCITVLQTKGVVVKPDGEVCFTGEG